MTIPDEMIIEMLEENPKGSYKLREMYGLNKQKDGKKSMFDYSRYKWLVKCPYKIGSGCCDVMKKRPVKKYEKETGRVGITGQTASESRLRTLQWLKNGCNAFDAKKKISNPMSFWVEQDVLLYLYLNKIPIASVYGDIVKENEVEGQLDFADLGIFDIGRPTLKTTGCKRTGCVYCGYGCQLEKPGEGRFETLKETHPNLYKYIMKPVEEGGLGYKEVIDWINENSNGKINIRY